ncbi:aldo/keto reductase [Magnetospira sp. QH-2]|uniref:aldo/keto reductase n=1 Tax=Magnetospira sp. (strain QH-2) TaxID=1288970 RepID=UPI0003E8152A|nr:aldo/keto reductase [Magnetospira sp. QH-2]CCQ73430.1 Aldo/keto reductase [Magnetospira sp. QH-2]
MSLRSGNAPAWRRLLTRRRFLAGGLLTVAGVTLPRTMTLGAPAAPLTRAIPSSGEPIPMIGMGSWRTFNVGRDENLRRKRLEVLRTFFQLGGGMIDSSPMYGSSEEVIGWGLRQLKGEPPLLSATKVWTRGRDRGIAEMETSRTLWGVDRFDLMQVHNLLDWEIHLQTLFAMKAEGRLRYVGITTSHGRRHDELAQIMETQPIDFVQLTYNIMDREVEDRLLPLAAERKIAVIANRPFDRGSLFDFVEGNALPAWASEFDCTNWAQFFLKFVISHPALTCAIPATSQVDHMGENMGAGVGRLPSAQMRKRMIRHMEDL